MTLSTHTRSTDTAVAARTTRSARVFPWIVFTLSFALLLSDYMVRQVLAAVFPLLKDEWGLTDTQLGSLTSVVALTVGLLAVPLSILGDRYVRARAVVAMAVVWCAATLGSALAAGYGQLLATRVLLGVGEAAYGSVGLAIVLAVFPAHRRASLTGAFMAGGLFGAVLGVALGGSLAPHVGWRGSFVVMAVIGLVLAGLYRAFIDDRKLAAHRYPSEDVVVAGLAPVGSPSWRSLVATPAVVLAYVASGLQLFVAGSLYSWLPSFFNRSYDLSTARAAQVGAVFIVVMGVGMIVCGAVTDRYARPHPARAWSTALAFSSLTLVLLGLAFLQGPGPAQLLLLALGGFFCAGTAGPAGVIVSSLTPERLRATAFGVLTLANNLLGLAAGPLVTGMLADRLGLAGAMKIVPLVSIAVIVVLVVGRRAHRSHLS
jgi:MFS family permease